MVGLASLMSPQQAAILSSVVAALSVGLNIFGGNIREVKRVELQKEVRVRDYERCWCCNNSTSIARVVGGVPFCVRN